MADKNLRIKRVVLKGYRQDYVFSFEDGLNVITGPIGTGKSSLLELIKFGLGAEGVIKEEIRNSVEAVALSLLAGGRSLTLTRRIGTHQVEVIDTKGEGSLGEFSAREKQGETSISEFLLDCIGLQSLVMTSSRAKPSSRRTTLSFSDVLRFIYVSQEAVDTSISGHGDSYYEPKRLATFEILMGLTDPDLIELNVRLGELTSSREERRREWNTIERFLKSADQAGEVELRIEVENLQREALATEAELAQLRLATRSSLDVTDEDRREVSVLEEREAQAQQAVAQTQAEVARTDSVSKQLRLDLERLNRAAEADQAMGSLDYVVCPRCRQPTVRDVEVGHCVLCLQSVTEEQEQELVAHELTRVREQLSEAESLESRALQERDERRAELARAHAEVGAARVRILERTQNAVSPLFDAIETLVSRLGDVRSRIALNTNNLGYWNRLRAIASDLARMDEFERTLRSRIDEAEAGLAEARLRLNELSQTFDELCRELNVPWYRGGRLNDRTYLPEIEGEGSFRTLSAGARTLVNVAYHLAALTFTLTHWDAALPTLLIVDSPRKNIGNDAADQLIGENLYRQLSAFDTIHNQNYQIILADNDVPASGSGFRRYEFSYAQPLIVDAEHPGPEAVERIGSG